MTQTDVLRTQGDILRMLDEVMRPLDKVMRTLAALGNDRVKKRYLNNGAKEPLFGVATGAMKPLAKQTGKNQALAYELYATGNYDAMYFAGIIAEPDAMTEQDYDRWMNDAYFFMLSDYVVAVTLAESKIAQSVAARWLDSGRDLTASGGWSCWNWLVGWRPDIYFDIPFMEKLLQRARSDITTREHRARIAIRDFVIAAGVSYIPLHEKALSIAEEIDALNLTYDDTKCFSGVAPSIKTQVDKGRIGFKRKSVRC